MTTQGFVTGNKENNWFRLEDLQSLNDVFHSPSEKPVLFFKHSARCSISIMVLSRFEKNWKNSVDVCSLYLINVIEQRPISNHLSELTKTEHQSPQVLLICNEKLLYSASHTDINVEEINRILLDIQ